MRLEINSNQKSQIVDISQQLDELISSKKFAQGALLIFVKHTTAALTISEVGENTETDLLKVVREMIPPIDFQHSHNPSHAPDHMISSIVGPSLVVPVWDGKLDLGNWQRIVLIELNGPRTLELTVNFF